MNVLVVAAHADDETLGCGGTIAKHIDSGDNVSVVFMTNGVGARVKETGSDSLERAQGAEGALAVLGISKIYQLDFPDNRMDSVALLDVVKALESIISDAKPSVIYTHFAGDLNVDHQVTHKAVMTSCRPQSSCPVKEIYTFEVLSSTEWNSCTAEPFIPQKVNDITLQWDRKLEALKHYSMEMRDAPHSRSYEAVESLAILRGSQYSLGYAECFMVERVIS
ncbi:PIG-L deacetylase family protein [Vibrio sp. 10N.261.52.C2]|uniref:PIG-L deacetylase family protein n=1 Tax=Vibrio sp. 10N.261.52.C2 TaxID=3229681 RepID=UPI0035541000